MGVEDGGDSDPLVALMILLFLIGVPAITVLFFYVRSK